MGAEPNALVADTVITMSVKDATVFCVVQVPGEGAWPLAARVPLSTIEQDGQSIELVVYPDGHLEAVVRGNDSVTRAHFQRVHVPTTTMTLVTFVCGDGAIELHLNGKPLALLSDSDGVVFEVEAATPDLHASVCDPETISQALQPWIARRHERFASRPEFKAHRPNRPKTLPEQIAELETAVLALDHLIDQVKQGKLELLPSLAASLRALVYWPEDLRPTWNPLLLRLADFAGVGLLVYSQPDDDDPRPAIVDEATRHLERLIVGLEPRHKPDRPMDLEHYLGSRMQVVRVDGVERIVTVNDLIGAAANTLGGSHYGEQIELDIESIRASVFFGTSALDRVLVQVAEVVTGLGQQVVHTLRAGE